MPRYRSTAPAAWLSVSLLALALAGCNKSSPDMSATGPTANPSGGLPALPAALPMQAGPATPLASAPPISALPTRRYVDVARPANQREAYAYLDRASDIEDEIGDAPPDYDYRDDDGVSPWVWETNGGDYRYAEPAEGGYRYYYYQPGARYPYLVRTRDHSYAYAGGALVAVYALNGALLGPDQYGGYRDQASRYFWRGQQLRQSAEQRPHQGVVAANWAAQRPQFSSAQAYWASARARQPDWQAYHAQNDPSQQPGWQQEHQQRQQVAQQFSGWQSRGLAGAPPAVLAAVGARAAVARAPALAAPQGRPAVPPSGVVPQNLAGQAPPHHRDMPGASGMAPMPNGGVPAAAAREQQLAAQHQAQHQAEASQGLAREAHAAQQQAAARDTAAREQAARQQMIANVHRQQDMAAQQEVAGRLQAQQRGMQMSAHEAQLHALAAQQQSQMARMRESREQPQPMMHERPQPAPAAHRAPEMAPPARTEAPRVPEARPPAPHVEAAHPEQGHPEQGHPEQGHPGPDHQHDRHDQ